MLKEYKSVDERNKDIEKMYAAGWTLKRLYGDGVFLPLTAVYTKKDEFGW